MNLKGRWDTLIEKENPLVSVIIPAYNIEGYIERSLESVRNQIYTNLQIIVVDDGSTDHTGEILDRIAKKDSRVLVLHKENQGVSAARNSGLDMAKGEYIGFVDGDDWIEPEMYQKLVGLANQYHADIAHCGYQMVFPDRIDLYYGTSQLKFQNNLTGVRDLMEATLVEPGLCNKLYHKHIFMNLRLDADIKINEDLLLNYYAFRKAENSVFLDEPYYHYIVRKNSASTSGWNKNKLLDPVLVLEKMYNEEEDQETKRIIKNRYVYQLVRIAILYSSQDRKLLNKYKKVGRQKLKVEIKKENAKMELSKKNYWMGQMAVKCPLVLFFLHEVYGYIKGTKNKYQV